MKIPDNFFAIYIRSRRSGHRKAVLTCDSLDHAVAIAPLILASPMYAKCYISIQSSSGDELANFFPEGMAAPEPQLAYGTSGPQVYEASFEDAPAASRPALPPPDFIEAEIVSCEIVPFRPKG